MMLIIGAKNPRKSKVIFNKTNTVDLKPWKYALPMGLVAVSDLILCCFALQHWNNQYIVQPA
jgi:uncharacterized sodium:solute symporter family permease YidK